MAKLDWKKLEQAFRREHARTGIKLQDWCRKNNISYGTARRYIKLRKNPPINTEESAQKNAQKSAQIDDQKSAQKMCRDPMTNPVMTRLTAMMAVVKNAQKTAQIRQKRNATADRAILTPLPGLATVTPTP
nr:hypothetical protein [Escherichia coli]HDJ0591958.1 hypothetical protein [Escherichia coli]